MLKSMTLKPDDKFAQESRKDYEDGEVIFSEGDDGREMYVVVTGEVTVSKQGKKGEILLATLTRGDFVGEMSLLESLPRSATARARGPTRLLAIQPGGFLLKIRRDPTFAFEMMQSLSRRIRVTNDSLIRELNHEGLASDRVKAILSGAEYMQKPDGPNANAKSETKDGAA